MLKKANRNEEENNLWEEGKDERECQDQQKQCCAQEHQGTINKLNT